MRVEFNNVELSTLAAKIANDENVQLRAFFLATDLHNAQQRGIELSPEYMPYLQLTVAMRNACRWVAFEGIDKLPAYSVELLACDETQSRIRVTLHNAQFDITSTDIPELIAARNARLHIAIYPYPNIDDTGKWGIEVQAGDGNCWESLGEFDSSIYGDSIMLDPAHGPDFLELQKCIVAYAKHIGELPPEAYPGNVAKT